MEEYAGVQRDRIYRYIVWARRTVLHTTMSLSYLIILRAYPSFNSFSLYAVALPLLWLLLIDVLCFYCAFIVYNYNPSLFLPFVFNEPFP